MERLEAIGVRAQIAGLWLVGLLAVFSRAETREYVVIQEIARLYREIPVRIEPIVKEGDWVPDGLIYGNTFQGQPVAKSPGWIELAPPIESPDKDKGAFRYVAAQDVEPEVLYRKGQGRFLVARDQAIVFLRPDPKSQQVMTLFKGEALEAHGVFQRGKQVWRRLQFESDTDEYPGLGKGRVGWIAGDSLAEVRKDLEQGSIRLEEIPGSSRGLEGVLSEQQKSRLTHQGFFVQRIPAEEPRGADDMADLYRGLRGPVFVSSDLFLHVWHLLFDRMLQSIEVGRLLPALKNITSGLCHAFDEVYKTAENPQVREAAKRNLWYFGVAGMLLNLPVTLPPELKPDVEDEFQRILAAPAPAPEGSASSYLPGYHEDYSQYKPRGHYTLSDDLKAYFRAMMHFGRKSFMVNSSSATLSAILMARVLEEKGVWGEWEKMAGVLGSLIGPSDDWTPSEYRLVMEAVYDPGMPYERYASSAAFARFQRKAFEMLKPQRIVSQKTRPGDRPVSQEERLISTAGFKFMGQRYTVDADFFQRLTSPSVGNDEHPKNLPSGLEVMSLLGSQSARRLLPDAWWKEVEGYPQAYEKAMAKARDVAEARWKESAYQGCLYLLKSLFLPTASRQLFMQKSAWQHKMLNSALSFWTELKHDTLLYSEQSYAESGSGPYSGAAAYLPPSVKGYIEPNPDFFMRLRQLVSFVAESLKQQGYLPEEYQNKFQNFGSLVKRSGEIASKEVRNDPITEEDYGWINALPHLFDRRLLLPDGSGDVISPDYLKMALIADVATDAFNGVVLLEGVGYPQQADVLIKDYWGGTRLARGYLYSHYEFTDQKRWSDEEWKALVYSNSKELERWEHPWYQELRP